MKLRAHETRPDMLTGSAYNLGTLLREEPTRRGILYFCACFFPLQSLWQYKMYWDSRFYTPARDMYHAFYELGTLVVLATAVLNIRPVAILSNPEEHVDLFLFCFAITLGMLLIMGRSLEVHFLIQDEPAAVIATRREAVMYLMMTLFFSAGTIYAGVKYFGGGEGGESYYEAAYGKTSHGYEESSHESTNDSNNNTNTSDNAEDDHHFLFRFLAGTSSSGDEDNAYSGDVAMAIMLAGFCWNHVFWFLYMQYWRHFSSADPVR